jgi:hypothetical protein
MLTQEKYKELWDEHFKKLSAEKMPPYDEYLERAKLFKEYIKGIISSDKKIKYILVAEAPPTGNTYFYNVNHLYKTPYFTAVCKAFKIPIEKKLTNESKEDALKELAKKGVVLLDLFPFAIPFSSSFRKKLMGSGITKHFWDGNIYSIKTQISALCTYLDPKWDLCLIAPPTVSCHIVGAYDAISITPCTNGIHDNTTFKSSLNNRKRGCEHKKVASDTSGNPNTELIKIAFDLPL